MFKLKKKEVDTLGPWKIAYIRFRKNKIAMAGFYIFVLILISVVLVPEIYEHVFHVSIKDYNLDYKNLSPSLHHLLGTDKQGRDVMYRLFLGGRISILVGVFSALITVVLGCIVGGVSGYYGGVVDNVLMRFSEIIYSLPFTPMIIAFAATMLWTPSSIKMYVVSLLIGLLSWPSLARLVRGQILSLKEQEFIQAAEALGISDLTKITRHLLPNVLSLIIVNATLQMASAILTEAGLSFLGMGVSAPIPSWGNMMNLARDAHVFTNYLWQWVPAGIMCFLSVISINLIGEGLRDAFDPKDIR